MEGLNLEPYCAEESLGLSKVSTTYDLFGVCNHYGRMGFGHYTAFVRDSWLGGGNSNNHGLSTTWKRCDDEVVTICSDENEVKTNAAYILFYRRREIKIL